MYSAAQPLLGEAGSPRKPVRISNSGQKHRWIWSGFAALLLASAVITYMHWPSAQLPMMPAVLKTSAAAIPHGIKPNFSLSRAVASIGLETKLDSDPYLGSCLNGLPQLANMPPRVCKPLYCLWSEKAQTNVDLWFHALTDLPPSAYPGRCPPPEGGQVATPKDQQPTVAFIISMHNFVKGTAQGILELFRTAHEVPGAEFILVDDGSTEEDDTALQTLLRMQYYFDTDFTYIRNDPPLGFGGANMAGIKAARAKYVVLVNSDLLVAKGWLYALWTTHTDNKHVGIAGPMMLGDKNLITEAGGVVWKDASAANYGRGLTHSRHELNYARDADYISAACVMMDREVFLDIGGFDPIFGKGYYEDTDIAMNFANHGLSVTYQPMSVVYHQEGTTLGDDSSAQKQKLMTDNKAKFVSKWSQLLGARHCPANLPTDKVARRKASPSLLWVDDIVPEPDRDSGSIRTMWILRVLVEEGYDVTFQPSVTRDPQYAQQLRFYGVDVLPVSSPDSWEMSEEGQCLYDVVVISRRYVFEASQPAIVRKCPQVPILYDTVDLHFLREARDILSLSATPGSWDFGKADPDSIIKWLASDAEGAATLRVKRDVELKFVDNSHVTIVVSDEEANLIRHYRPNATVVTISNVHDFSPRNVSCSNRNGIMFVGNFNHPPNKQAVEHLLLEVLPIIKNLLPPDLMQEFRVHVVGSNSVPESIRPIVEQKDSGVLFHGWLSDELLYMLYNRVKVVVAPLLSGAGVKGKVNQAMKLGVPVVATKIATEGMHTIDGVNCLVANNPREFAEKVRDAYIDCGMWSKLSRGGYDNIKEWFSVDHARLEILRAFYMVGAGPKPEHSRQKCQ